MNLYEVIGKATCHVCGWEKTIDDPDIDADTEESARETFKSKHRLCPECSRADKKAAVKFYPGIDVFELPCF
jgi:rubredoxin